MEIFSFHDPNFYTDYVDVEAKIKHQFTITAYLVRFWESRYDTGSSFYHALFGLVTGWNGYLTDLVGFLTYTSSYWGMFVYLYIRDDVVIDLRSVRWWKYSINENYDFTRRFIWYLIYKTLFRIGGAIISSPRRGVGLFLNHQLTKAGLCITIILWTDRILFGSVLQAGLSRLAVWTLSLAFQWLIWSGTLLVNIAKWSCLRLQLISAEMRSPQQKYVYMPLQPGEYRVLQLRRRLPLRRLRASMITTTVDASISYEAISYTWGTARLTKSIIVDGKELEISANAHDILESCSSMWRSKAFWIDQVCINQFDSEEKAIQVSMMFSIYRRAAGVAAHLGFAPLASSAVAMLIELIEHSQYDVSALSFAILNQTPAISLLWAGLCEMLASPWFGRVWIIQEIAAARKVKVIYGSYALDWEVVMTALMVLCRPGFRDQIAVSSYGTKVFQSVDLMREIQVIKEETNEGDDSLETLIYKITPLGSLPQMLCRTAHFEATDPRDKIFAVQALARSDIIRVAPDYLKPVEHTYIDLAHHVLTRFSDPFCMMAHSGIGVPRKLNLPTWVPDWTCNEYHTAFNMNRRSDTIGPLAYAIGKIKFPGWEENHKAHKRVGYQASGDTHADVVEVAASDNNIIQVKGIMIDEVRLLSVRDQPTDAGKGTLFTDKHGFILNITTMRKLYDWHQEARDMAMNSAINDSHQESQQLEEAFWRTLIGDIYDECRPAPDIVREDYRAWVYVLESQKQTCDLIANGQIDVVIPRHKEFLQAQARSGDFTRSMGLCASKKRFMVTQKGRMGIAPLKSQIGDAIFLPLGSRTPWILRRVQLDGNSSDGTVRDGGCDGDDMHDIDGMDYQFVGECYMHGVMSGELVRIDSDETATIGPTEAGLVDEENGNYADDLTLAEGPDDEAGQEDEQHGEQNSDDPKSHEEEVGSNTEPKESPAKEIPGCIYIRLH